MNTTGPRDICIRRATVADAEGVAITHVASWRAGYAGQLPDEFLAGLSVVDRTSTWARIFAGAGGARTVVAVADGVIRGFASVGPSRDEDATEGTGELWALYTHPDAWRRGIGSALHAASMSELATAGFSRATLWVLTSNARARSFYEGQGWLSDGHTQVDWRGDVRLDEMRYRLGDLSQQVGG